MAGYFLDSYLILFFSSQNSFSGSILILLVLSQKGRLRFGGPVTFPVPEASPGITVELVEVADFDAADVLTVPMVGVTVMRTVLVEVEADVGRMVLVTVTIKKAVVGGKVDPGNTVKKRQSTALVAQDCVLM
jgi:hypothetical protein